MLLLLPRCRGVLFKLVLVVRVDVRGDWPGSVLQRRTTSNQATALGFLLQRLARAVSHTLELSIVIQPVLLAQRSFSMAPLGYRSRAAERLLQVAPVPIFSSTVQEV